MAGQPDPAIEYLEKTARSYPRGRVSTVLMGIGMAHLIGSRFEEAATALLASLQLRPSGPWANRSLASCYAHMGRLDEAREIVERLRTITSVVIPNPSFLRNAEHREFFLSGLRLAASEVK